MSCYLDLAHIFVDRIVNLVIIIIFCSMILGHAAVVSIERLNLLTGITNDTRERLDDLVRNMLSTNTQNTKLGSYQSSQPRNTYNILGLLECVYSERLVFE